MSDTYQSRQARYSPPHITLHMPFEFRPDKESELESSLQRGLSKFHPFDIPLHGFGSFPPRVIFVKPGKVPELMDLHARVGHIMRTSLNVLSQDPYARTFHPHMTIAFRDLRKELFLQAWDDMSGRNFNTAFKCHSIWILKKAGSYWLQHTEIPF